MTVRESEAEVGFLVFRAMDALHFTQRMPLR